MYCQRCNNANLISVMAKCDDRAHVSWATGDHHGYVPRNLGIGGGDYVRFTFCADCGQQQGQFPLELPEE